ncbi:hypothetical protein CA267_009665 [Alteromonas pelagimontana]|uniref:Uncharacterized protein n=1 Tax=Alteromonas pelagimontana TaxID=1858656 RepID=A0A6M4MCW8_9ALTE|nr:capsule biosynthesis GfcC family protein [Alteromonas pelagimontana]QJR81024.1 hypothetical protein CA267_009665 [Alteromonas pelagimontana]
MKRIVVAALAALLTTTCAWADVLLTINNQQYRYLKPVRLSQALAPVALGNNWYWPASAIYKLNDPAVEKMRFKVIAAIDDLALDLQPQDEDAVALRALRQQIENWQLAKRILTPIHYDAARLNIAQNPLITDGQYIVKLTTRPSVVHVSGLVTLPGEYEFQPMSSPFHYVKGISLRDNAEPDYIYAVDPKGNVDKVGVAYWNRNYQALMPGSQIFVPLFTYILSPEVDELNRQIAQLAVHRVLP